MRALLPGNGGARIGLMYEAASPNTTLRTATVLARDGGGRRVLVPEATAMFDDLTEKSWAAFEGILG